MKDVILQHVYPDGGMVKYLSLTSANHKKYAYLHNFDFEVHISHSSPDRKISMGSWDKVLLIKDILERGVKHIVYIDADAYVFDLTKDLREGCPGRGIGAVKFFPPESWGEHWNVGVLYITNGLETREFVRNWIAGYPGPAGQFEQGVFNKLGKGFVTTLPSSWNHTVNRHHDDLPVYVKGFHGNSNRFELMSKDLEINYDFA